MPFQKGNQLAKRRKIPFSGEKNPNWKGGVVYRNGYRKIYVPQHPRAENGKYVPEHILVMEKELGRYISLGEDVHHKNGDKQDNRIVNLLLLSRSDHSSLHYQQGPKKLRNQVCSDIKAYPA
jgi:hypothetical protein